MFQREAQVLASLQHPCIPRYLDYFEQDDDTDRRFYIVQVGGWVGCILCSESP